MLLFEITRTSAAVGETRSRIAKIERLASCLRLLKPQEVSVAVSYLSGELPQGTVGVGWAALQSVPSPAESPSLEILDVDASLSRLAVAMGPGSRAARREELAGLFGLATEPEATFLKRLLTGELRQGALEGVMVEAIAKASGVAASDIRRAHMLAGRLGPVAAAAVGEGAPGVARFRLALLTPVQPMLAQSAGDATEALLRTGSARRDGWAGPAGVEWKIDGARIQVHKLGDEVRAFTRNLADVTERLPEVVEIMLALPAAAMILDGEIIALRPDGRPLPFQMTMGRFGSKLQVEELRRSVPLSSFFFDCLHLDGDDLIDKPSVERVAALRDLRTGLKVPRIVTGSSEKANELMETALHSGHEGIMVKSLGAPYEAGRRGAGWLKVKRADTLDLVVLAAEWGHGRRRGWLSNLHLGARDLAAEGGFVMLGKTFKGMTDKMLTWQTERLLELETHRAGITVFVRPEIVVEVAFDGVQESSRYPGGVALRFARVKALRPDKRPEETDTIDTVLAIRDRQQS